MSLQEVVKRMVRKHGENFRVIRAGQQVGQVRGIYDSDKREIACLPGADVKAGDRLIGEMSKNEHEIDRAETTVHDGAPLETRAYVARATNPPVTYNHITIGTMSNSAVQQGSPSATQIVSFSPEARVEITEIIAGVLSLVDRLGLSPDTREELMVDVETIQAQLKSSKPRQSVLQSCLSSIKSTFENATIAAASSGTTAIVQELIGRIGQALS